MSTGYAIQSTIEISVFILLVIGFCFEGKIAQVERKVFKKIANSFKKMRRDAKRIPQRESSLYLGQYQ